MVDTVLTKRNSTKSDLLYVNLCPVFLRLERIDWMAQAEQLKQQTLATLSDRDQQLRQLTTMLEEARTHKPKLQQEHYQREVGVKTCALTPDCKGKE